MMEPSALWPGGPTYAGAAGVFPLGTDAVLLGSFARAPAKGLVGDLGTGSGILPLLLLWDRPGLQGWAVDCLPAAAECARRNLAANGLAERCPVVCGDLRERGLLPPSGRMELVTANPPYAPPDAPGTDPARRELAGSWEDWCAAAAYLLKNGGRFCVACPPERLFQLWETMNRHGMTPSRLRLAQDRPGRAPFLALAEGRRSGGQGLRVEPLLLLRDAAGRPTEEYRRIYRLEEEIP